MPRLAPPAAPATAGHIFEVGPAAIGLGTAAITMAGAWWLALLIGIAVVTTGTIRARTATAARCRLIETAADLHCHTLAEQLRLHCPGPLTVDVGNQINTLLRKDPPPSSS